jgi:hypothetical protein
MTKIEKRFHRLFQFRHLRRSTLRDGSQVGLRQASCRERSFVNRRD